MGWDAAYSGEVTSNGRNGGRGVVRKWRNCGDARDYRERPENERNRGIGGAAGS